MYLVVHDLKTGYIACSIIVHTTAYLDDIYSFNTSFLFCLFHYWNKSKRETNYLYYNQKSNQLSMGTDSFIAEP